MTLENLMEEKQLNFNQPLLSVRRGSLIGAPPQVNKRKTNNSHPKLPSLPYYKSDLKSGPIRNPGVVPFRWEQTPGKPKDEDINPRETTEKLPLAPRLPPGRLVNHKKKPTDNVLNDSLASSSRSDVGNISCSSLEISSTEKVLSEFEGSDEGKKDENILSSEDENVIYEDARDALSRTESFFFNCSISGVSGTDGPTIHLPGPLMNPQAREFMMDRFLPAAKAVASETHQFAFRKYPVAREQTKPVSNVVTKRIPRHYDVPNSLPHNIHGELEGDKEDDYVDNFDDGKDMPAKLCGLLPRFCLLNPIPGMRDHAHLISSVQSAQTKPIYGGLRTKTAHKDRTDNLVELKRITGQYGSTNKSTPAAHFGRNGAAPLKNESPQSFLKERGILGLPEDLDSNDKPYIRYKASLSDHWADVMTSPVNPAIEKTLYVDSEAMVDSEATVDSQDSNSSSSEVRKRNPSVDYSLQDNKTLFDPDLNALASPKSSDTADACPCSAFENPRQDNGKETLQVSPRDQSVGLIVNTRLSHKSHVQEAKTESGPSISLSPLLPKSPSESWLSRTLPSMSSKHQYSKSLYLGNIAFKTSHMDPKHDRTLKTSNGQHLLFRPTKELATIMEN